MQKPHGYGSKVGKPVPLSRKHTEYPKTKNVNLVIDPMPSKKPPRKAPRGK